MEKTYKKILHKTQETVKKLNDKQLNIYICMVENINTQKNTPGTEEDIYN